VVKTLRRAALSVSCVNTSKLKPTGLTLSELVVSGEVISHPGSASGFRQRNILKTEKLQLKEQIPPT
jgi:hypothetical protein